MGEAKRVLDSILNSTICPNCDSLGQVGRCTVCNTQTVPAICAHLRLKGAQLREEFFKDLA